MVQSSEELGPCKITVSLDKSVPFGESVSKKNFLGHSARLTLSTSPPADQLWRPVDVVLDCLLAKEGSRRGAFGSGGDRVKTLLVLKQVPVLDDGSLEGITNFQGDGLSTDDSPATFEASGMTSLP